MSTLNDLERAYLEGLGKTGSINSMRSAQYGAISDPAILATYAALSTLTPVEDFSINDHMRCGLGGFTDDEINVLTSRNLMVVGRDFKIAADSAQLEDYESPHIFTWSAANESLLIALGAYGPNYYLEMATEGTAEHRYYTPIDVDTDQIVTAYMRARGIGGSVTGTWLQMWLRGADGNSITDFAEIDLTGTTGKVYTGPGTEGPGVANQLNPAAEGSDTGITIGTAWQDITFTFRVSEDTAFIAYEFGCWDNVSHDLEIDRVGIWAGDSTSWRY